MNYQKGNIIQFGMYPQSRVEDTAVLEQLNAKSLEWQNIEANFEINI